MTKMKKNIKLRMIFMGTSLFAKKILSDLIENKYNVVGVFTQPDQPPSRRKTTNTGLVKECAQSNQIPVFQPMSLDEEAIKEVKKLKPDIVIVASYGKILSKEVLEIPGFGSLNIHASPLPKFRGPSPIQNTLLCGEKETGITIILMNEGVDTGDIISQEKTGVKPEETAEDLTVRLSELGSQLLLKTLPVWVNQKIKPEKQADSGATLCQLIERADGHIVWEDEAQSIYNKFRAFQPWPGIFSFWDNEGINKRIKLTKISVGGTTLEGKHSIGEVIPQGENISVRTQNGEIILEEVQPEGKDPMNIKDFINGHSNFIGKILK